MRVSRSTIPKSPKQHLQQNPQRQEVLVAPLRKGCRPGVLQEEFEHPRGIDAFCNGYGSSDKLEKPLSDLRPNERSSVGGISDNKLHVTEISTFLPASRAVKMHLERIWRSNCCVSSQLANDPLRAGNRNAKVTELTVSR
eukprot:1013204-Amphidinium_carterae.1